MATFHLTFWLLALCSGLLAQEDLDIPSPARLKKAMTARAVQINNVGPPSPYPRAKSVLGLPEMSLIADPAVEDLMDDIKEGLKYVLQTKNEFTFPVHGTGSTGLGAVFDNMIEPGDKVLVLSIGHWGNTMADVSRRLGADLSVVNKTFGMRFKLEEVEIAVKEHKPQIVCVVMGESVTGVYQPMDGIGELVRKNDALLLVDAVAVVGILPVDMDKNKMDALYINSHKGIGGIPGLAAISFGPRAVEKLRNRKIPPRAIQTDLMIEEQIWNTNDRKFIHALSPPLMYGLREALATIAEEGLQETFKRHARAGKQLNDGLEAMGFKHFVPVPEDRLTGITTVLPPKGKDPFKMVDFMLRNLNLAINPGYGPLRGEFLMIGYFGSNADPFRINNVLNALKIALESADTNTSNKTTMPFRY